MKRFILFMVIFVLSLGIVAPGSTKADNNNGWTTWIDIESKAIKEKRYLYAAGRFPLNKTELEILNALDLTKTDIRIVCARLFGDIGKSDYYYYPVFVEHHTSRDSKSLKLSFAWYDGRDEFMRAFIGINDSSLPRHTNTIEIRGISNIWTTKIQIRHRQ